MLAGMQGPGTGFCFVLQDFLGGREWKFLPALPWGREKGQRGELAAQQHSSGRNRLASRGKVNWCKSLAVSRVPEHYVLAQATLEWPYPALLQSRAGHPCRGPPCGLARVEVLQSRGLQETPVAPHCLCGAAPPLPSQAGKSINRGLSQIQCSGTCC